MASCVLLPDLADSGRAEFAGISRKPRRCNLRCQARSCKPLYSDPTSPQDQLALLGLAESDAAAPGAHPPTRRPSQTCPTHVDLARSVWRVIC